MADTPEAKGYVSYNVKATCPNCGATLQLNQAPYNDDTSEYTPAEDELGLALFGTVTEPAKWNGLDIPYTCCVCNKPFNLTFLEI